MSDLISRQDAIDAMMALKQEDDEAYGCEIPEGFDGKRAVKALQKLPSAETERKWTTVTKALPYTNTNVLVTVLDDSGDTPWRYTSVGWLTPDSKYWVVDNDLCYGVIAWMPIPEKYLGDI